MRGFVAVLAIVAILAVFLAPSPAQACNGFAQVRVAQFAAPLGVAAIRQDVRGTPFRPFVGPIVRQRVVAPRAAIVVPQAFLAPQAFVVPQVQQYSVSAFVAPQAFFAPQAVVSPGGANCQAFFR